MVNRTEILEAFAHSKPHEFDAFYARYIEDHPDPIITEPAVVPIEEPVVEKKKRTSKVVEATENV
jgi:hypothetical protein